MTNTELRINMEEEIDFEELQVEYRKLYKDNKGLVDSMHYAAFVQQGILPLLNYFGYRKGASSHKNQFFCFGLFLGCFQSFFNRGVFFSF